MGPSPKPCPVLDLDQLRRLLRGDLDDQTYGAVESHVEVCTTCQQALDHLGHDDMAPVATVADEAAEAALPEVPGYRLTAVIKGGGMGVVYQAVDEAMQRDVAVKVVRARFSRSESLVERFVEEARITGQLQHPGVPPVHQIGRLSDGRPFLAMKLIKGQTLAEMYQAGRDDQARGRFVGLFENICHTVAYAHNHDVIHRDLKPDNVMIGKFGEVQVMDWGLAKHLKAGRPEPPRPARGTVGGPTEIRTSRAPNSYTQVGSVLGSWRYMPPEQAGGEIDKVDKRADVFALGGILCFLLTGEAPYRDGGMEEVRLMAIRGELSDAFARLDAREGEPELVALARRCLSPRREDRPDDAEQVARTVTAIRTSAEERARRAELERVQAEADRAQAELRAREEKTRRRYAVAMALSAALAVAGAAAAYGVIVRQQAARREQTDRLINLALGQAESLRKEASAAPLDEPSLWKRAAELWRAVGDAADRAAQQLASGTPTPALRTRADATLAAIRKEADAARHDRDVLDRFEEASYAKARITDEDRNHIGKRPYLFGSAGAELYAGVFRDEGIDVDRIEPAVAAAMIRVRKIAPQMVVALDDWYMFNPSADRAAKLLAIADAADGDDTRKRIRAAIGRADRAELLRIADGPEADALSPQSSLLLAVGLESSRDTNDSARVAERALRRYPGDFWLNDLGGLYFQFSSPPRIVAAASAFQSALAVRPGNELILTNLGMVWQSMGAPDRALAALSEDLLDRSANSIAREAQIGALLDIADWARAEAAARAWVRKAPNSCPARSQLALVLSRLGRAEEAKRAMSEAMALPHRNLADFQSIGVALAVSNRYREAIPYLREAVKASGANGELRPQLGFALFEAGQVDEGMAELRKGVEQNPWAAPCHFLLAKVLAEQRRWDEAIAADLKAIERMPYSSSYRAAYAEHLRSAGRLQEARVAADEAVQLNLKDANAWFQQGICLNGLGRRDEAAASFRRAVGLQPWIPVFHEAIGSIHRQRKERDAAVAAYTEAIRLAQEAALPPPYVAMLHNGLANAYFEFTDYRAAIAAYRRAVALDGKNPVYLTNLANTLYRAGDKDGAFERYREATALAPDDMNTRTLYCRSLIEEGRIDEAVVEGRDIVRRAPANAAGHGWLGVALIRQGLSDAAQDELRTAIRLDPLDAMWQITLAENLGITGKAVEAVAIAQAVVRQNFADPLRHDKLGNILQEAGRYKEAAESFREAVRLAPKSALYVFHLAGSLRAQGQPARDEALKTAREARDLAPDQPEVLARLAAVLADRGEDREAEARFRDSAALPQTDGSALDEYGSFLLARKRYAEAEAVYLRAIELAPKILSHHYGLVRCYQEAKRWDKAIEAHRASMRLKPNDATAEMVLGLQLLRAGRPEDALAQFDLAAKLRPAWALPPWQKGRALDRLRRHDEAVRSLQQAGGLMPKDAATMGQIGWQVEQDLGESLMHAGRFSEALAALRWARDLAPRADASKSLTGEQQEQLQAIGPRFAECERLVELDALLARVRGGSVEVTAPGVAIELSAFALRHRDCPRTAARLAEAAFARDRSLAEGPGAKHRMTAACAAATASAGRGEDAAGLDPAEKARLRELALGWLRAELAAGPADRAPALLAEPMLACVRDPSAQEALPVGERAAWKVFWVDVREAAKGGRPAR